MKFRPAFNPFSRRVRRTEIVLALAGALALGSGVAWGQLGYQTSGSVIGDDVMYSIGGGNAVSMGRAAGMRSIGVGVGWNSNLICGDMSIQTTLKNQLNGITNGFQQIMSSVIQSATSAVASLPALIIQRADPGLYNLLTNGVLQARLDFDRSKLTCRAMAEKMAERRAANSAGARWPKGWRCAMPCRARMRSRPSSRPRRAAAMTACRGSGQQRGRLRPARDQGRRRCHPRWLQPGQRPRRDRHLVHCAGQLQQSRARPGPRRRLPSSGPRACSARRSSARAMPAPRPRRRRASAHAADPGGVRRQAAGAPGPGNQGQEHDAGEPARSWQCVCRSRAA